MIQINLGDYQFIAIIVSITFACGVYFARSEIQYMNLKKIINKLYSDVNIIKKRLKIFD